MTSHLRFYSDHPGSPAHPLQIRIRHRWRWPPLRLQADPTGARRRSRQCPRKLLLHRFPWQPASCPVRRWPPRIQGIREDQWAWNRKPEPSRRRTSLFKQRSRWFRRIWRIHRRWIGHRRRIHRLRRKWSLLGKIFSLQISSSSYVCLFFFFKYHWKISYRYYSL